MTSDAAKAGYFDAASLAFLSGLARNNNKVWFTRHRSDYEAHVRVPFERLLADLQPVLVQISPQFRADPSRVGGSLFRIHRDARYSHDKSPYKAWQGARLYHVRRRETATPAFYLHLQPGGSFIGAGLWHPEPAVLRQLRDFVFENPASWEAATRSVSVTTRFSLLDEDKLVRAPRGYPPEFAFIEDLKLRNFVLWRPMDDAAITAPDLASSLGQDLHALAPFVDYLCAALDLAF